MSARGNEVQFHGQNGFRGDMAAKGQMRVSERELDEGLPTPVAAGAEVQEGESQRMISFSPGRRDDAFFD